MDEVDNIIIHSLRQIGCNIDDDVISLSSFSPELLVETVTKCLRLIKPSLVLPETLPQGMAQRFSVTASLAEACANIGFRGDIGYQTFLYSNVSETRRVFMFLIERLPKETEKLPLVQPLSKLTTVENEICRNISIELSVPWIPPYCTKFGVRKLNSNIFALIDNSTKFQPQLNLSIPHLLQNNDTNISPELRDYWLKRSPSIFQQTNSQNLYPSIIHLNDLKYHSNEYCENVKELLKFIISESKDKDKISSELKNKELLSKNETKLVEASNTVKIIEDTKEKYNISLVNNEKNIKLKKSRPLDELNEEIENLKQSIQEALSVRKKSQLEIQKLNDFRVQHEKELISLKEERKIKERTCILLENPEENVAKIEQVIISNNERMKRLQEQWEIHRKPLVDALEKSKSKNCNKISENKVVMDQVKIIQEKISDISEELKVKSSLHSQLSNELQKISKVTNRSAYTTRILEIIGNIRKQKNDIDRVLRDTRDLQKQINYITGQLDRQFMVTDDLLFKTAKRDEHSKKAYKLLAKLHSDCSDLVSLVQETGAVMREVRDLEDQIEKEKSRNTLTNLEKITFDLQQMEKESKELQQKIRKVENQITQG